MNPRPARYRRAALAGVAALLLLTGTGTSYAGWVDSLWFPGTEVQSGELRLGEPTLAITLHRDGEPARDVTATFPAERFLVGDRLVVTSAVPVHARGASLAATLHLDTTALQHSSLAVSTDTSEVPLPSAGAGGWHVTEADDGALATVLVTITVRGGDGGNDNLQGAVIDLGGLTWRLTQEVTT